MKLALKHVLTAVILILSLAAPVAAGPHEDARTATGYNAAGFNPYTGRPVPPPPPGTDLHDIDKNGNPIPFKYDPATGQRIGAQPAPQDPAALSAKAQEILDAQTKAAPDSQPPPLAPRVAGPAPTPAPTPTPAGARAGAGAGAGAAGAAAALPPPAAAVGAAVGFAAVGAAVGFAETGAGAEAGADQAATQYQFVYPAQAEQLEPQQLEHELELEPQHRAANFCNWQTNRS